MLIFYSLIMPSLYQEFFAGFLASSLSTIVFHPLDIIRIKQISEKTTITTVCKSIYSNAGLRGFYRALPIGCLAYSITYGVYFTASRHFKNANYLNTSDKYMLYLFSSIPATICSITATNALWTIKSTQISSPEKLSLFQSASHIYKTYGFFGFQKGILFGYLNGLNGIITFVLYDIFVDLMKATTSTEYALCSGSAKTIACFVAFPLFSLRIQQQINQKSICGALVQQLKSWKTIYCGLPLSLVQMVPRTALMMVLFEALKKNTVFLE